jgi:hypothetical protein
MRYYNYFGRPLDVRQNIRFFGGHEAAWIHQRFPRIEIGPSFAGASGSYAISPFEKIPHRTDRRND